MHPPPSHNRIGHRLPLLLASIAILCVGDIPAARLYSKTASSLKSILPSDEIDCPFDEIVYGPRRHNCSPSTCLPYLPMGGSNLMVEETLKLAYAVQALSGTGACRLFADFHKRFSPDSHIYIPVPTWSKDANVPQRTFHYYHLDIKGLDFASLMDDVKGSFFLLHACAHNPTGVDPTEEQWKEMSYQFKVKGHFAFFDMAYQGFASGDPEKDVKSIRIFLEDESLDWVFSVIC
ncbi:hypothetical protein LXL04_018412 [Taraxacum kok-saghyz]